MNYKKSVFLLLYFAISILIMAPVGNSTALYVRKDGTGDFIYIAEAIFYSQSGDTIFIGPGFWQRPTIRLYQKALHFISEEGPEVTTINYESFPQVGWTNVFNFQDTGGECSVIGFTIKGAYGGSLDWGGGICCTNSRVYIRNNIITDNWCAFGGGISCYGQPSQIIENNLICHNEANSGGAIEVNRCSPIIRTNTIVYNYAGVVAGAIYIGIDAQPIISNNIIVSNLAPDVGGIYCNTSCGSSYPGEELFTCNDVWNNTPTNYGGSLTDQTGINGNISEDPLFCGIPGSGNFYLQSGSPCAASNVPDFCNGIRMGTYPVNCEVGTEATSWGKIKSLYK